MTEQKKLHALLDRAVRGTIKAIERIVVSRYEGAVTATVGVTKVTVKIWPSSGKATVSFDVIDGETEEIELELPK